MSVQRREPSSRIENMTRVLLVGQKYHVSLSSLLVTCGVNVTHVLSIRTAKALLQNCPFHLIFILPDIIEENVGSRLAVIRNLRSCENALTPVVLLVEKALSPEDTELQTLLDVNLIAGLLVASDLSASSMTEVIQNIIRHHRNWPRHLAPNKTDKKPDYKRELAHDDLADPGKPEKMRKMMEVVVNTVLPAIAGRRDQKENQKQDWRLPGVSPEECRDGANSSSVPQQHGENIRDQFPKNDQLQQLRVELMHMVQSGRAAGMSQEELQGRIWQVLEQQLGTMQQPWFGRSVSRETQPGTASNLQLDLQQRTTERQTQPLPQQDQGRCQQPQPKSLQQLAQHSCARLLEFMKQEQPKNCDGHCKSAGPLRQRLAVLADNVPREIPDDSFPNSQLSAKEKHNQLERQRRARISDLCQSFRCFIPENGMVKADKVSILEYTLAYIQFCQKWMKNEGILEDFNKEFIKLMS